MKDWLPVMGRYRYLRSIFIFGSAMSCNEELATRDGAVGYLSWASECENLLLLADGRPKRIRH